MPSSCVWVNFRWGPFRSVGSLIQWDGLIKEWSGGAGTGASTDTGAVSTDNDHRLRELVHGTGDVTIATDLGVPRSTARGWLGKTPNVVVSLDVTDLRASESTKKS